MTTVRQRRWWLAQVNAANFVLIATLIVGAWVYFFAQDRTVDSEQAIARSVAAEVR